MGYSPRTILKRVGFGRSQACKSVKTALKLRLYFYQGGVRWDKVASERMGA